MNALITLNERGEITLDSRGSDPLAIRAAILDLKDQMLALPKADQIDLRIKQTLMDGVYMREMFIPKGTLLVGKIHRKACLNIVAAGDISILTERGVMRVQAGFTAVSEGGSQKVGYAHEDTLFINVHRTDETDFEKIGAEMVCEDYAQLSGEAP